MVMSITPLNAFAVTEYGIWIGDEQVTSDKTWSKQGWKYDIQSKTLTLLGYNMATIGKTYKRQQRKAQPIWSYIR